MVPRPNSPNQGGSANRQSCCSSNTLVLSVLPGRQDSGLELPFEDTSRDRRRVLSSRYALGAPYSIQISPLLGYSPTSRKVPRAKAPRCRRPPRPPPSPAACPPRLLRASISNPEGPTAQVMVASYPGAPM